MVLLYQVGEYVAAFFSLKTRSNFRTGLFVLCHLERSREVWGKSNSKLRSYQAKKASDIQRGSLAPRYRCPPDIFKSLGRLFYHKPLLV